MVFRSTRRSATRCSTSSFRWVPYSSVLSQKLCFYAACGQPFAHSGLPAGEIVKHFGHAFFIRVGAALFIASLAVPGFAQGADSKIGFVNGERFFRVAGTPMRG